MAFFGIAQGVGLTDFPTEQFATILGGIVATISGAHVAQVKRAAQRGGNVGAEVVSLIQGIREEVEDIRDYAAETQGIASAAASNADHAARTAQDTQRAVLASPVIPDSPPTQNAVSAPTAPVADGPDDTPLPTVRTSSSSARPSTGP